MDYESLREKMEIIILLKTFYDTNKNAEIDEVQIEPGIELGYYLDIITKQIIGDREKDYYYFQSEEDEETGEFVDYTGMMVYEFPHPTIYKFFQKLENIKGSQKWEDTLFLFDNKLLSILRKSFHGDLFNDFLEDESGVYKGLVFAFSTLNNTTALLTGLLELVDLVDGLIVEMEKDGL